MKKTLASITLGAALLAVSGTANADPNRAAEPKWGIRPEKSSAPSVLDFARWLARRLNDSVGISITIPVAPTPIPGEDPASPPPVETDEACNPERIHCPTG